MSKNPSDIMARLSAGKQKVEEKKTKKAQKAETAQVADTFEITEADIKSNPAYSIITDGRTSDKKKIEKIHELKRYNKELTEEENEKNIEAFEETMLYFENQLMASSQKGIEFTNDNAFALYDETVQELFGNIKTFKGYIEPFVKALEVLQKARDAGIPANELIDAVAQMQEDIAEMNADKEEKDAALAKLESELNGYNDQANSLTKQLEQTSSKLEQAQKEKSEAEASWNVFKKGGQVSSAESKIKNLNGQIEALNNNSKANLENLARHNTSIESLKSELSDLDAQIIAKNEEFAANEDSQAIATLIEITGKDFKDKREEVVTAAQTITKKAIEGIEKSISRFDSGRDETGTQLNTVSNLNSMVGLMTSADKMVRASDATFISEQQEIVDRIKAEADAKGEDPRHNPDYQTAKEHLDAANEHVASVVNSAARASDLEGKLTRQTGTFKGLRDAYTQKGRDATKLRTSAAVEIPAQLAVTVKSVEMATATESNNMVNDAFADLSATTQKSVSSIFDTVSAGAGQNNEQLRKTLESTMNTIDMMNQVEADLKEKAKEGYEVRQALDASQKALKEVTGTVSSAMVDAEHEAMDATDNAAPAPSVPKP